MFFRLMLILLAKRIDYLSSNNTEFRKTISTRRCVIQFKTHDGNIARYFVFAATNTSSSPGLHEKPSITFSFRSAKVARNLILSMAKDPGDKSAFLQAINQGKLKLQGDISLMMWFMVIADFFPPTLITNQKEEWKHVSNQ